MKIRCEESKKKMFKDIECGDVFIDDSGFYCMKTDYASGNIIFLDSGIIGFASDDDKIELVDCELIVRRRY